MEPKEEPLFSKEQLNRQVGKGKEALEIFKTVSDLARKVSSYNEKYVNTSSEDSTTSSPVIWVGEAIAEKAARSLGWDDKDIDKIKQQYKPHSELVNKIIKNILG